MNDNTEKIVKTQKKKSKSEHPTRDSVTKKYMNNPERFADAFNFFLYHGEQIIKPDMLREMDTSELAIPYGSDGAASSEQKYRDILKTLIAKTDGEKAYCILGIENQSNKHYAMPVKNGLYDFLQLSQQVSKAGKSHKSSGTKLNADEYLSNFHREDKLLPVITLVIYYGADKWDAPLTLREMYSITDEAVLKYAADYRINLIAPESTGDEELDLLKTGLREVMKYIKYSADKNAFEEKVKTDKRFKAVDRDSVEVINTMTSSKIEISQNEEVCDMCEALKGIREDGIAEGKAEGKAEGIAEGITKGIAEGITKGLAEGEMNKLIENIRNLMKNGNFTIEKSMELLGVSEEQKKICIEKICTK